MSQVEKGGHRAQAFLLVYVGAYVGFADVVQLLLLLDCILGAAGAFEVPRKTVGSLGWHTYARTHIHAGKHAPWLSPRECLEVRLL